MFTSRPRGRIPSGGTSGTRQINFFKDSEYAYDGGSYEGAEVSINDASGTKANIDVQVIYSLDAGKVEDLYAEYGTRKPS